MAESASPAVVVDAPRTELGAARLSWAVACGLSALTGVLYFLAFPGIDLWPLAFVACAPLTVALEGQSPRRAAVIGLVAGFVMNVTGFYWLFGTLKTFGGFPDVLSLLFMALLCAYQGGRIAACGLFYALARRQGWPRVPVFLLAFVTSELVYPVLFPWYYGNCAHPVPALGQLAELGGPYLVGLMLLCPGLALSEHLLRRREGRPVDGRVSAVLLAVPLAATLFGVVRIHQVDARVRASEPVKIGLVQGNQPLVASREQRAEGLRRHLRMTEELRKDGVDFVVWSEGAVSAGIPSRDYDGYLQHLFTRSLGVPAVLGAVLVDRSSSYGRAYNTALSTDREGHTLGRYDKEFLLAFGEYIPFGDQFPVLYDWSPNSGRLTPGTALDPLPLLGHTVSALICYEDILPSFVNRAVRRESPDFLVNLTNDAWFGDTTEPWIHLALSKMRAIEHRRYLARATNSGVSAIVDPVGRVVAHSGTFRDETVQATAHWLAGGVTGYELLGDAPWWLSGLVLVVMMARDKEIWRKRRRAPNLGPSDNA